MINKNSKIFVAGHNGLVGSAIVRKLLENKFKKVIFEEKKRLNLLNQKKVENFFKKNKPEYVVIAAARVGGIKANSEKVAEFIYENIQIQNNLIHYSYKFKVKSLIFLGSSCIYPKYSKQPIKESYLLTDKLEDTNEAYAIAKIAGVKMCEYYNQQYKTNFKSLMPTNTFGPNDNYNKLTSHFIPALIKKAYEIKIKKKNKICLWGNGLAKREVIYVDDLADACIFFMKKKTKHALINIGTGKDYRIKEYAKIILKLIVPKKNIRIVYDPSKPNGTPRKLLDISLAKKYGWKADTNLTLAIKKTYLSFVKYNKI
mgnify:CR=1 FL=1